MNWNQFLEADSRECIKNALTSLQNAKASLVEALTSIDEALESESEIDSDVAVDIRLLKASLKQKLETLESIIQQLDD